MNAQRTRLFPSLLPLLAALAVTPVGAQVPVDDSGAPLADYESFEPEAQAGNEDIPLLTQSELQELVGPIALYPDDLLAIVLPASTYPLQLVQAQRFLEDLEENPSLQPDEEWDDSVIALLNYPEVVELLNEDLDWTWRLGEAVVAQQADVVSALEGFRDRAYAAGNLKSDAHQTVARNAGAIEITPVDDDVIYVPYYEPERVVVYQPRPVYHYYPRAYPVYYYPYPVGHAFNSGYFWGVTTAFTVGWVTDSVQVIHHSYHGHPYYGYRYWDGWWYRRPTIQIHNHYYAHNRYYVPQHRYSRGDHWRPRYDTRRRLHDQRITRSDYYSGRNVQRRSQAATVTHQAERHRSIRNAAADNRRHQRQTAVPAATRAAHRQTRPEERSVEQRQLRQAPREARREQRSADQRPAPRSTVRPERRVEERQRQYAQRQQPQPERTARREHRGSDARQERRSTTPPRRESAAEPRQRPAKQHEPARNTERRKHASSRGDSERRQRH